MSDQFLKTTVAARGSRFGGLIEIVTCDTTNMKETAFGSLATCKTIFDILQQHYLNVRYNEISCEEDLEAIVLRKPHMVVLCVKYLQTAEQNSKIWLSDYFLEYNIPHTGSGRSALEFDSNKSKAKIALQNANLPTAKFFLAHIGSIECEAQLPIHLPLFVKPLDAANGYGVDADSIVRNFTSYQRKVSEIEIKYKSAVLVEEVLSGPEFTVAILDCKSHGMRRISPVEVVVPRNKNGDRILGSAEKLSNCERLIRVSEPIHAEVSKLASDVFSLLGAMDIGRIDIKLDALGVPHFIEANLLPGLTPATSYFPRACELNHAMSYDKTIREFVDVALKRNQMVVRQVS